MWVGKAHLIDALYGDILTDAHLVMSLHCIVS